MGNVFSKTSKNIELYDTVHVLMSIPVAISCKTFSYSILDDPCVVILDGVIDQLPPLLFIANIEDLDFRLTLYYRKKIEINVNYK